MVQIHSPDHFQNPAFIGLRLHSLFPLHLPFQEQRATTFCVPMYTKLKPSPTKGQLRSLQIEAQRATVWLLPAQGSCFVPLNTAPRSFKPGIGSSFFRSRLFFRFHPVLI
jgi:hypothetical protein